jgi:hypothetical protein
MYAHQIFSLHAPMFSGLSGLGAALPLSLSIDKPYQVVGGKPKFTLIGAPPGSPVYWSSYKDGKSTGELNASYDQKVESNGTVELEGGAWTENDIGLWDKIVLVKDAQDNNLTAKVTFRVSAAASTQEPTSEPASGGILDTLMNDGIFLGNTFVPYLWLAGGGIALYFFTKRR